MGNRSLNCSQGYLFYMKLKQGSKGYKTAKDNKAVNNDIEIEDENEG